MQKPHLLLNISEKQKMGISININCLIWFLFLSQSVNAIYFYIEPSATRCFNKELYEGTVVVGKYLIEGWDAKEKIFQPPKSYNGVLMTVEEAFDRYHQVVNQRGPAEGDFTFTALDSGSHRICFIPLSQGWISSVRNRMFIDIKLATQSDIDTHYESGKKKIFDKILKLKLKIEELKIEQDLLRIREGEFVLQSESTNIKVIKYCIFQISVLIGTCIWQLNHLKRFFLKQKVI